MKNTKRSSKKPKLLCEFINLVNQCKHTYDQERVFNRALALAMSELFTFGRHTITQQLLSLGIVEEDWSSWYRLFSEQRYDEAKTSRVMLKEMLSEVEESEPFVVGGDGFHVPRCSLKMAGSGWMRGLNTAKFRPGLQRGQRFVETSWLTPVVNGYSRAIPIQCLDAFTEKAVPGEHTPRTEVEAALKMLTDIREEMDKNDREEQQLVTLNDGSYDTLAYWSTLPERTIGIVRTARNRCLYHLPKETAHGNRRYGNKVPAPCEWLKDRKGFKRQIVRVRGRDRPMRYRVEGPFVRDQLSDIPLFLLVIGGGKRPKGSRRKNYKPCFFLVSAVCIDGEWCLPFPLERILVWLWQRWELEVAHRNMKSGLGLGEKQCWNPYATISTVQWSVWVYSLMLLSGYRVWKDQPLENPPGRWRKAAGRWSFNTLWRAFRSEIWDIAQFQASWLWSQDNWLENEALKPILFNSVLASART